MITRGSVRRKSREIFQKVITLRKLGFSYTEIRNETGIAKSTINNWLTFARMTLSKEHLLIQSRKRLANNVIATEASRITRARNKDKAIQAFIQNVKKYLNDPFFVGGVLLYEAEGSKGSSNGFSNSDFRIINVYIKFLERYILSKRDKNLGFRLYVHLTRKNDLSRIINFWTKQLSVKPDVLKLSWKHNKVSKRRINPDYVGQMEVRVRGMKHFTSKMLAVSDIILKKYQKV